MQKVNRKGPSGSPGPPKANLPKARKVKAGGMVGSKKKAMPAAC